MGAGRPLQTTLIDMLGTTPEGKTSTLSAMAPRAVVINSMAGLYSHGAPIQKNRWKKLQERDDTGEEFSYQVYDDIIAEYAQKYARSMDKSTAVFFPMNDLGEDMCTSFDATYYPITLLLKDRQGRHPVIVGVRATDKIVGQEWTYTKMKKRDFDAAAGLFKNWLLEHPTIDNLIFTDLQVARTVFPNVKFGTSFSSSAYTVYHGFFNGKKYRIMFTLTPLQLHKQEDKGYDFSADILAIIRATAKAPFVKKHVVKDLPQLKKILKKIRAAQKELAVDIETTGLNPNFPKQEVVCCSFSDGKEAWVFVVRPMKYKAPEFDTPLEPWADNTAMLRYLLEQDFDFIFQNGKFEMQWFKSKAGLMPAGMLYDTLLMDHWLFENLGTLCTKLNIRPGAYSMDRQIPRYLGINSHKGMLDVALEKAPYTNPFNFPKGEEVRRLHIRGTYNAAGKMTRMGLSDYYIPKLMSDDFYEPYSGQYAKLPLYLLLKYNCMDAYYTFKVWEAQMALIQGEYDGRIPMVITELFPKEMRAIATMELEGAPINYDKILEEIAKCDRIIDECGEAVKERTNGKINIDSNDQLLSFLTSELGIDREEFYDYEEEKYTVDEDTLVKVENAAPWVKDLILYKKANKARNTYLIPFLFHSYKGRMFFTLNTTGTATGRLSSNEPNIQNLPKGAMGDDKHPIYVKQVIEAGEGRLFADLDLATAEVKVLTAICPDPGLIKAINNNFDLHCYTAALMTNVPYEEVYDAYLIKEKKKEGVLTPAMKKHLKARNAAKRTTFGAIYRIGPKGLSQQIGSFPDISAVKPDGTRKTRREIYLERRAIQEQEASDLINLLFTKIYPLLTKTFAESDWEVFRRGYGETIFGRRRRYRFTPIFEIAKALFGSQIHGERFKSLKVESLLLLLTNKRALRQNVNFLVQSPTSDYMQFYIARLMEKMPPELDAKFHFTVHDSVVLSYRNIDGSDAIIRGVCDEAMNQYLPSLYNLPVIIGYGIDFSAVYSPVI